MFHVEHKLMFHMEQIGQKTVKRKNNSRKTGDLGESLAVEYLQTWGYQILNRNYWQKWGELDIVARKEDTVHFIEVKTASYETKAALEKALAHGSWRPEEQVHQFKLHQIEKALETWLGEHKYDGKWQIDVMGMRIVPSESYCTVNLLKNIIID